MFILATWIRVHDSTPCVHTVYIHVAYRVYMKARKVFAVEIQAIQIYVD